MIFKTFDNDLNGLINKIGIFNKSFNTIGRDLSTGQGIFTSLFSGNNVTKKDIQSISLMEQAMKNGATTAQAWQKYMTGCTVAAKQQAKQCLMNKESLSTLTTSLEKTTLSAKAGQLALKGLAIAGNMLLMWGISEAITFVARGIDNLANSAEHCKERVDELVSDFDNGNNTIQQHSDTISKIASRYSELSHGVNELGGNVSLTNEEYAEYQDICNQIADMYPTLVKSYDEQGNAILKLKGNVEGLTQALLDEKKANAAKIIESDEIMENYQNTREHGVFDSIGDYFSNFFDSQDELTADMISEQEKVQKYKDFLQMSYEDIKSLTTKIGNDRETIIQRGLLSKLGIDSDITKEEFATFRTDLEAEIVTIQTGIDQALSSVKKKAGAYLLYNEDYSSLSENEISVISSLLNNIDEDTANSFGNDDKNIAVYVNKIVNLIHNAKPEVQKAINDWFILGEDVDISTKISALDAIIKTYEDNGIVVPIYFETQKKELNTLQEQYNDAIEKAKKQEADFDWDSWFKENSINTQEEIDRWNKIAESATNAADARKKYTEGENGNKSDNLSGKSFDEVWSGLKESEQNKFTKLVNNGKLTAETFDKIGSSATALKETGLSVEDLCDKIRSLVGLEQKLTNLSNSMKKVGTAYKDYKKNGYVSSTSLNSMPDSFKNLDGYSKFSKIAGSKKSSKSDIQGAFNDIVTEYVKTSNILDDVTEKNKNKVITGLRDAGIINAKKVVDAFLNSSDKQFSKLSSKFNKMSNSELQNFIKMLNQKGKVSGDFYKKIGVNNANMINGLSKQYKTDLVNWIELCEKKRDAYNQLVKAVGGNNTKEAKKNYVKLVTKDESKLTAEDMGAYEAAQKGGIITKTDKKGKVTAATKYDSQQKKLEKKLGLKLAKVNFDVDYKPASASGSGSGSGSKGSKGNSSKSKELFNWIERKLERLNTKLDLVKAKYDNLPLSKKNSISLLKAENKNLDEQIKLLKKVQSVNNKSYSKYMKKANSVGLSSSLKKKVQNGQIKGSYEKLIKEYGENTANKIQKYQDYYDKAQSAKKNSEDAKKSITDTKIEKLTRAQNYYDTLNAMNQAYESTAKGLSKNNYVQEQIEATKQSYNYQIKIAKAQGDYNKAKQLEQEKEKAILDLQRQKVENIKAYYDNQVGILDNSEKEIQNKIDLLEAQGNIVSKSYYSSMSGVEKQKMADRQAELNKLKGELAKVTRGSDDWYELQNDIQSVKDSINESQKAIVENTKAIGELIDTMYAEINAIAENLGSEFDFISGLARGENSDSDTGRLTDTGLLQLYTSGLSYSTYKATLAQSNQRLKEIQDANKQDKLLEGYASLKSQKEAENEIAKTAQEQANSVKSYGDKIIEIVKDAISSMTEHLQDLIDARKEALDEEKDLRDYERSILEKTKNVSSLQKQYMAATGDTSEEGRLRMAQLRKSLDEAQQDLQDTEYDKYISDQQEMLDNLMSEYTDLIEKLQKNENELLKQGIQAINANKAVMQSILYKTADDYGYPTSQNLTSAVTALNNGKITADIVNGESNKDSVTEVIKAKCNEIITAYNKGANGDNGANGGGSAGGNRGDNAGGGSGNNNGGVSNVKTNTAITQNGNVLGGLTTYTGNTKTEKSSKTLIEQAVKNLTGMGTSSYWTTKKNPSSKTNKTIKSKNWNGGKILTEKGGYALYNDLITRGLLSGYKKNTLKKGKNTVKSNDMWAALNKAFASAGFRTGGIAKLVKSNGEDGLMMARNGEGFVSPENVQDIRDLMNITPNLTELVSNLTKIPDFKRVIPETTKNVSIDNITFEMPNVKNVSDFTDTIKKPEQQRAFAVAIGDAIAGKKLNINRY